MFDEFQTLDRKFHKACEQIRLLNKHINDLQSRYDRAFHTNQRSFRYSLRLKLTTYEGVHNMYHEYAKRRAEELESMKVAMIQRSQMSDEEDSYSDPESWYIDSDDDDDVGGHYTPVLSDPQSLGTSKKSNS